MSEKVEDRIKELEDRLANTVPNKHTQRSINFIRAQLAKCRDDLIKIAGSKKGGGGGFNIKKDWRCTSGVYWLAVRRKIFIVKSSH